MNPQLRLRNVSKSFPVGFLRKKTTLTDLSFEVGEGEIVGLLGPNGSGKSTTIKLILGFLKPDEGEILIGGFPPFHLKAKRQIGYLPENPRFQRFLSGKQILAYYGSLLGIPKHELTVRIEETLSLVNLTYAGNELVRGYSKGMCQRLAVAQALLGNPSILIFDEPMSGLDPYGRREIRNIIHQIHKKNPSTTLFFSTHILSDVEQLCSSVLLLKAGKLHQQASIDEILKGDSERFELIVRGLPIPLQQQWLKLGEGKTTPAGIHFNIDGTENLLNNLNEVKKVGAQIVGLNSHRKSLEDTLFGERSLAEVPK